MTKKQQDDSIARLIIKVEEREMINAPAHLKPRILEQCRRADVQLIASANCLSKKLEFFCFSLKVGAAVLCSLSLLAFTPALTGRLSEHAYSHLSSQQSPDRQTDRGKNRYESLCRIHEQIDRFLNLEVYHYDEKTE